MAVNRALTVLFSTDCYYSLAVGWANVHISKVIWWKHRLRVCGVAKQWPGVCTVNWDSDTDQLL